MAVGAMALGAGGGQRTGVQLLGGAGVGGMGTASQGCGQPGQYNEKQRTHGGGHSVSFAELLGLRWAQAYSFLNITHD
jgi:hypothetical protein